MKTKVIIFDKDGTPLDLDAFWIPVTTGCTEANLRKLGCTHVPVEEVMAALGYDGSVVSIEGAMCCGTYGDIAEKTNEVLARYGAACDLELLTAMTAKGHHDCIGAGRIVPNCENIAGVMERLKKQGIILAVVTADGREMTEDCLNRLGIASCFTDIFTDDGTHPNKPDPYCIFALKEKYGLTSEEIIMVGDTIKDMQFARNGGIRAIGLAKSEENRNLLLQWTDTVLPDLSRLPEVLE